MVSLLSITIKTLPISKIITNFEFSIHNIPVDNRNHIRNDLTYWIQNWLYNEDISDISKNNAITYKHSFDIKNTKILDFENNLKKD